jgi:methylmalonyl-CoA epimerase
MLSKIHHVGVVVKSADEALGFYRDALGLEVTEDRVIEDQGVRGILLKIGQSEIELLEPTRNDTGVARFLESRGEGMHHICFESDDVDKELEAARGKGIQLIDEKPRPGLAGMICFLHPKSNHGVLVEFATPLAGSEHVSHGAPSNAALASRIDHVGIVVKNLDEALGTYERHFGFKPDPAKGGEVAALGIKNAFVPVGESDLEFIQPLSEEGPVAKFAQERGEGQFLLSLAVADVNGTVEALRAKGARAGDPNAGVAFVSMRSTFGVNLQLVQRG